MRPDRWLFALALALGVGAAGRDAFDNWIDATDLPLALAETSAEVRDRNGALLRAYQVGDGIWRLAVQTGDVDQGYVAMLVRFEDKRFWSHHGVDPLALLRAAGQAVYLEATTARSARLYEKLGFVVLGAIPDESGAVYELAMWRPPQLTVDWA